jgi:hypothetical protein
MIFAAAEMTMWQLVQRYTGRVGYQRGVKSEGLSMHPPVIDCSGWVGFLLKQAMQAENDAAHYAVFRSNDMHALQTWSDRIIHELQTRTGFILDGHEISARSLPRCATIGLKMGEPAWASNHPRLRGITHAIQVVCRPDDGAQFVSESFGGAMTPGIGLTPLDEWLRQTQTRLDAAEAWAVDPFQLAHATPPGNLRSDEEPS